MIFQLNFADFLNDLTPRPFLSKREQVKPARFLTWNNVGYQVEQLPREPGLRVRDPAAEGAPGRRHPRRTGQVHQVP